MESLLAGWWDNFCYGSLTVAQVFAVALLLATVFGLLGASAKLSRSRVARGLAQVYTVVFRGTPELVVVLIVYFGAAVLLTRVAQSFDASVKFVDIPPFWAGAGAIGLVVGAYMTETFRGAFMAVSAGQVEAAAALGLTKTHAFWFVRLPQMWRLALPNFGNHMLSALKDTALISVIGLEEIVFVAQMATAVTQRPFFMYLVVALIYLAMTSVITLTVAGLERYANRHLATA